MKAIIFKLISMISLMQFAGSKTLAITVLDSLEIYNKGKETFRTYCGSCHDIHKEVVGPMLASIPKKRPIDWLVPFIKNSQRVIVSGDDYANLLYEQYDQNVMPNFAELSDNEVNNILYYIEAESLRPEKETNLEEDVLQNASPVVLQGKQIFQQQCSNCHYINKEDDDGGPALGSVTRRRSKAWLVSFIRNSQKVIQAGDPYAVHLFNSFNRRIMVPMEFLTENDISSILEYIELASSSSHARAGVSGRTSSLSIMDTKMASHVVRAEHQFKSLLKIEFVVFSILGACIHITLIIKLFKYLQKT
jgi:cytochrome c2